MAMAKRVQSRDAVIGERFTFHRRFPGEVFTVEEKATPRYDGQWICLTCGVTFDDQFQRETHLEQRAAMRNHMLEVKGAPAVHVLAWRNFDTGKIEAPK